MYKITAVIGLVGLASAALENGAPPAYQSAPPASDGTTSSSAAPVTSSVVVSSSIPAYPSSTPAAYTSSASSAVGYSSVPVAYSSSASPVSSSAYAISSSVVPSSTSSAPPAPTCDCWSKCFEAAGVSGEGELCGNSEVSSCIATTCSNEEDKNYWTWYNSFCSAVPTSSVTSTYSASATVSSSSSVSSSATPTPSCWNDCFGQAGITSEEQLCGNQQVNSCIYYTCSAEEDQAYWSWYNSFCPAPSTSTVPASETYPVTTSSSTVSSTSSAPTTTATGDCWEVCFAENNVESQASLCGNDAVSKCIHDTCSADLDKAYWDWYNGYCTPTTGVSTLTTICTPTEPATTGATTGATTEIPPPYTTTYETTYTTPASPVETAPVDSGLPPAPSTWVPATSAAPPAPYNSPAWSSPYSYPVAPTGTGSAWSPNASPSGYVPVPATGAGAANKAGGLIAVVVAAAAFL